MKQIIKLEESDLRDLIREVIMENFGWHAGDLGKSEPFSVMSYGGRGTGHFGTGTYFCSSEDKLQGDGYRGRPKHKVSFDGYNLVRINDGELGMMFHSALKYINNDAFRMMVENGDVDKEMLLKKCHIIASVLFGSKVDNMRDIILYREKVYDRAIELLKDYAKYYNSEFRGSSDRNSISTELLKSFGFEGVDVRGNPDMDNTTYGSVIYNLREGRLV